MNSFKFGVEDIRVIPLTHNGFFREGRKTRYVMDTKGAQEIEPFKLANLIRAGYYDDIRAPAGSGFYGKWMPNAYCERILHIIASLRDSDEVKALAYPADQELLIRNRVNEALFSVDA